MRAFSEAVKWVFLDLDNTLWDFDANAEEAIKELYHRHELHLHCDFHVDQFLSLYKDVNAAYWLRYEKGEVTKEVLRTARFTDTFNAMGVAPALQPANVWQEYLEICPVMTRMMPGALECLAELKKKYRIALLTNGFENTQQTKIAVSGIGEYVDFMMTSEAVGMAKPDSRFLLWRLKKRVLVQRKRCIWVILGTRTWKVEWGQVSYRIGIEEDRIIAICLWMIPILAA